MSLCCMRMLCGDVSTKSLPSNGYTRYSTVSMECIVVEMGISVLVLHATLIFMVEGALICIKMEKHCIPLKCLYLCIKLQSVIFQDRELNALVRTLNFFIFTYH
jgi:hypothetical protein